MQVVWQCKCPASFGTALVLGNVLVGFLPQGAFPTAGAKLAAPFGQKAILFKD